MSRWSDAYKNHAFWNEWRLLKDAIATAKIDDESVLTSVEELARLRKVISYLDGLLEVVDSELIPASTWTSFQQQLTPCMQAVLNFSNDRNLDHLVNANSHADNLLSYVKPWIVVEPNLAVDSMKKSLESYNSTLTEYSESYKLKANALITEIGNRKNEVTNIYETLKSINNEIKNYNRELFLTDGNNKCTKDRIQEIVLNFENEFEKINQFYNELLIDNAENNSIQKKVMEAFKSLQDMKDTVEKDTATISQKRIELDSYYLKIFGNEKSDDEKAKSGLRGEIEKRFTNLDELDSDHKKKYAAQLKEIEQLLPGATSAGLASAFKEMKEPFKNPIRNFTYIFYAALVVIICISVVTLFESPIHYENITDFANSLGWKLSAIIASAWLAVFASKRRSEAQRLQQEYAHKESFAMSYHGFKTQIEALGDENQEIMNHLITKAVDSIAYNASSTLDGKHEEKTPLHEVIDSGFSSALKKLKNVGTN